MDSAADTAYGEELSDRFRFAEKREQETAEGARVPVAARREPGVNLEGKMLSVSSYQSFLVRLNAALRVDDDGRMVHPEVLPYFWQAGPAGDFIRSWLRSRLPAIMVLQPTQEAAFQRAQLELNAANSDSIPQ